MLGKREIRAEGGGVAGRMGEGRGKWTIFQRAQMAGGRVMRGRDRTAVRPLSSASLALFPESEGL